MKKRKRKNREISIDWQAYEFVGYAVYNIDALTEIETAMRAHNNRDMFHYTYEKPSAEIVEKMKVKITELKAKIDERKGRIKNLRNEYKITDAIYIDLLEQAREAAKKNDLNKMSYSVSNTSARGGGEGGIQQELVIGAGVVNNLLTETDFVKTEEQDVARLELICRNLKDSKDDEGNTKGQRLGEEELKYLGF